MLQARLLGKELYVGVHSDEEILANKGPTVMRLDERITAVEACKWTTKAIPNAPYVTDPDYMDKYECPYVVHGDDITTDANGEDCYQVVKDLGRFVVVKRTPNISTTDLVGRMLLMSKDHHYPAITKSTDKLLNEDNLDRFKRYATDSTGLKPGSVVYLNRDSLEEIVSADSTHSNVVYIDGGFDLFHPGHIEVLKIAHEEATKLNAKVIVGLHDDAVVNEYKGLNYPIMNLLERALCVLQCRYVDGIILGAPYKPTPEFLKKLGATNIVKVYHGPTEIDEGVYDEIDPNIYGQIGKHKYDQMNTEYIVNRVLANKQAYEERQKRKGWKAEIEKKLEAEEKKQ